jgi:hypothetical protein
LDAQVRGGISNTRLRSTRTGCSPINFR